MGTFIGELDGGGVAYLRRYPSGLWHVIVLKHINALKREKSKRGIGHGESLKFKPNLFHRREVEETALLPAEDQELSKTILVPGVNHAQVSSGPMPEDVIDNDIDPELSEEDAHQVIYDNLAMVIKLSGIRCQGGGLALSSGHQEAAGRTRTNQEG